MSESSAHEEETVDEQPVLGVVLETFREDQLEGEAREEGEEREGEEYVCWVGADVLSKVGM